MTLEEESLEKKNKGFSLEMIHTAGIKGGGGRRVVGVGEDHDMGSDGMQCIHHPHINNPGNGICAFCLQEKLGKLVSSSFLLPIPASSSFPSSSFSSSSSSSSSFRSHIAPSSASNFIAATATTSAPSASSSSLLPLSVPPASAKKNNDSERARLPFLLAKKQKDEKKASPKNPSTSSDIIFKRSKSTTTPKRNPFLDDDDDIVIEDFSPRIKRNGFWSFLYLSSKSSASSSSKKLDNNKSFRDSYNSPRISTVNASIASTSATIGKPKEKCLGSSLGKKSDIVVEENDDSPTSQGTASVSVSVSSFERKVSRSRSVGCGSRSFSGDFFERISTGFGDCALRRVESQREGKPRLPAASAGGAAMCRGGDHRRHHHHRHHHHCLKERVRCGGIFSGFMLTSSSSSSSSSSYRVSSSADDTNTVNGELSHGRSRNWGWAFASPMRAFSSKTSSKDNKKRDIVRNSSVKNATPDLSAIPSLLTVSG